MTEELIIMYLGLELPVNAYFPWQSLKLQLFFQSTTSSFAVASDDLVHESSSANNLANEHFKMAKRL